MRVPEAPPQRSSNEFLDLVQDQAKFSRVFAHRATDRQGRYLHWDSHRFRPTPGGLTPAEAWIGIKHARRAQMRSAPFRDKSGKKFQFMETDAMRWTMRWLDSNASGNLMMPIALNDKGIGRQFHVATVIEEAYTSSRLEGAATTRARAKEIIRQGRAPRDKSERMVLNNFHAMEFISDHKGEPLTLPLILELHRIVTEDTLDRSEMAGTPRGPGDRVVVEDSEGNVLHEPPDAASLFKRLDALCTFANAPDLDQHGGIFIHPIVKAIIIHFMIGYDHPFVDGNGRTARALFYWQMLKSGYWLAEFISISSILLKAPLKYGRAFLETETDDNDLTYFLIHQLDAIKKAVEALLEHLTRKARETDALRQQVLAPGRENEFNHRQIAILGRAIEQPRAMFTIEEHRRAHAVSYQTARTDLLKLAKAGLLETRRSGLASIFVAPVDLTARLDRHRAGRRRK